MGRRAALIGTVVAAALASFAAPRGDPPAERVASLTAVYLGPAGAGAVVDSDIAVLARLDDGTAREVSGWELDSAPATLERNGFATVWVSYGGLRARVDVECSDVDEADFKARCVAVARGELVSAPGLDAGMKVRVRGAAAQVDAAGAGGRAAFYLSAGGAGDGGASAPAGADLVAVAMPAGEGPPAEGGAVTVWGRFVGMREVDVAGGEPAALPVVSARYVEAA